MPVYAVYIKCFATIRLDVRADSEDAAKELAMDRFDDGDGEVYDTDPDYRVTKVEIVK